MRSFLVTIRVSDNGEKGELELLRGGKFRAAVDEPARRRARIGKHVGGSHTKGQITVVNPRNYAA